MLARKLQVFWLSTLLLAVPTATAQITNLSYFRNYFVTGDYGVGGVGVLGTGVGGIAKAKIGVDGVPPGATILAAYLYWETMGDGTNGKFNGNAIVGQPLGASPINSPCTILPQISVYRADVLQYLNVRNQTFDPNPPPPTPGGKPGYDIELPDSGDLKVAPLTEGASLLVVWSQPRQPFRGIVLFDGAFTLRPPNRLLDVNLAGFYQARTADAERKARVTHIVGGGQPNTTSNVIFNEKVIATPHAFSGAAGKNWDNAEFDVSTLVRADDGTAKTSSDSRLLPSGPQACLTWAAVAFSTTVQDSQKDGILDTWKRNGFHDMDPKTSLPTGEFIDLKRMGADPTKPNIFIEMDWLKAADHNHKPDPGTITDFTAAFTKKGYKVIIDMGQGGVFNGGEEVDEDATNKLMSWKGGLETFKKVVPLATGRAHFQYSRRFIFHYVVWAHQYQFRQADGTLMTLNSCGVADLPGGDQLMTFGGGGWPGNVGSRQEQTGCLLHEFGHNLNLQHGGNEGLNNKPQYQSLMNYSYTLAGLKKADGSVVWDYSSDGLGALNETDLNENNGVGNTIYSTIWYKGGTEKEQPTSTDAATGRKYFKKNIDWNKNGVDTDMGFAQDLNNDGMQTTYSGFNDWPNVDLRQVGARPSYFIMVPRDKRSLDPEHPESRDISLAEYSTLPSHSVTGFTAVLDPMNRARLAWDPAQQQAVTGYRVYRYDGDASVPPSDQPPCTFCSANPPVLVCAINFSPTGNDLDFPSGPGKTECTDSPPPKTVTYFVTDINVFNVESDYSNLVTIHR